MAGADRPVRESIEAAMRTLSKLRLWLTVLEAVVCEDNEETDSDLKGMDTASFISPKPCVTFVLILLEGNAIGME